MALFNFWPFRRKIRAPRTERRAQGTPASPGEGPFFNGEGADVARAGYNTAWMWKQWQREVRAARAAREDGLEVVAVAHEDLAAVYDDIRQGLEAGSPEMEALAERVVAESDETLF